MKSYSIGRDKGCDIVISDDKDYVSRRHAILTVDRFGKMTIKDQSLNGTYVNGIKITSGEPVPVSRKDIVSFAHVYQLDWSKVPTSNTGLKILAAIVAAIIVLAAIIFGYKSCSSTIEPKDNDLVAIDSTEIKAKEKALQDSIDAVRKDSIEKAVNDSIIKAKDQEIERLKKQRKTDVEKAESTAEPKKEESGKPTAKPIG